MTTESILESVRKAFPHVVVRGGAFDVSARVDGVGRVDVERGLEPNAWRVSFGTTAVNRDARELPAYVAGIATLAAVAAHCERLVRECVADLPTEELA